MPAEKGEVAPGQGPPPDVQHAAQPAERHQQPTAAGPVALRRRRDAALRLPPMEDGGRDPLDGLAGKPAHIVEWGGYDVRTLGLVCAHGENCPARHREAI
jgi:hypothetical protein